MLGIKEVHMATYWVSFTIVKDIIRRSGYVKVVAPLEAFAIKLAHKKLASKYPDHTRTIQADKIVVY